MTPSGHDFGATTGEGGLDTGGGDPGGSFGSCVGVDVPSTYGTVNWAFEAGDDRIYLSSRVFQCDGPDLGYSQCEVTDDFMILDYWAARIRFHVPMTVERHNIGDGDVEVTYTECDVEASRFADITGTVELYSVSDDCVAGEFHFATPSDPSLHRGSFLARRCR